MKLHLETRFSRAARGGTGNVKCSGNYAVALRPLMEAKKLGFHDNIFLELETFQEGALVGIITFSPFLSTVCINANTFLYSGWYIFAMQYLFGG